MTDDLALELRVARRKAGLSQSDCAHLLEVHPSKISLLESGKVLPSIAHICRLSIIYGRSFEGLLGGIYKDIRRKLHDRLHNIPKAPKRWLGRFHRDNTLQALSDRLTNVADEGYEG
jgi:transcriptional regulator with XRE-family HTH domain